MENTENPDKWEEKKEKAPSIGCPSCEKPIKVARFGYVNDVYFCPDCKLLRSVSKKNS